MSQDNIKKELSANKPVHGTDFYGADPAFKSLLESLAGPEKFAPIHQRLQSFSAKTSGPWDLLAEETANNYSGPKIEAFDRVGNHIDQIWLPPPVRRMRSEVVEAGIFENGSRLEQFTKVYFLGHLGEASVTCPLACTEGLVRAIEAVGSDFLKKEYLPKIKSAETPLAGAQFVTEMDMGSDVGALLTKAVPDGPAQEGRWRLYGEKWFCSAIDEYFLIAARPEGAPAGIAGVGIFLVPRMINGKLNDLRVKRLKSKIGTKDLPTAEIDLNGAVAFNIGSVRDGFKSLMNYVLNTSRLMNAAAACGTMARAYLEGENYARQRGVFGKKMIDYPLVQESLQKIRALASMKRTLYFSLVSEIDRNPQKDINSPDAFWQRFLINLCKYRTAIGATEASHEAILLLGGNGTIETFSILPKLYRDSMVLETWEGTHNTLALQIARDGLRFPFKDYLERDLSQGVESLKKAGAVKESDWLQSFWKQTSASLDRLSDPEWVAREARRLMDRLGLLMEISRFATWVLARPSGPGDPSDKALLDRVLHDHTA